MCVWWAWGLLAAVWQLSGFVSICCWQHRVPQGVLPWPEIWVPALAVMNESRVTGWGCLEEDSQPFLAVPVAVAVLRVGLGGGGQVGVYLCGPGVKLSWVCGEW